jgi:hypothetical protein
VGGVFCLFKKPLSLFKSPPTHFVIIHIHIYIYVYSSVFILAQIPFALLHPRSFSDRAICNNVKSLLRIRFHHKADGYWQEK